MQIVKRDGRKVEFDKQRIINAIEKAMKETEIGIDSTLSNKIAINIKKSIKPEATVEEISDIVEKKLMASSRKDVAKKFIIYRNNRNEIRENKSVFMKMYDSIIKADNQDLMQENANVDGESPMGQMGKIGYESARIFATKKMTTPEIRKAIENNYIHPHDWDFMPTGTTTCLSSDTIITIQDEKGEVFSVTIDYFDDLMTNNRVDLTGYQVLDRDGWTKIKNVVRRKIKSSEDMYEIKTKKSLPLKATEDHKIPIIRNDKELLVFAKEIQKDDLLIRPDYEYTNKDNVIDALELLKGAEDTIITNIRQLKKYLNYKYDISNLYKHINSNTSKRGNQYLTIQDYYKLQSEFYIPKEVEIGLRIRNMNSKKSLPLKMPVTPELARFVGYLISDGSVYTNKESGNYHITITNKNKQINRDVQYVMEAVFNESPTVRWSDGEEYGRVLCGKVYCSLISALGIKVNSFEMRIPDFIISGTDEIKTNFIRALYDGDGCISSDRVSYSTVCKEVANQLILLLQSLGIESSLQILKTKGQTGNYKGVDFIRNGDMHIVNIMTKDSMSVFRSAIGLLLKQETDPDYSYTMNSSRVIPTEVKYIRKIGYSGYVYDMETSSHWFVANGIVVHNCTQIPLGKLLGKGFNTGHGHMRTPQSIGSATALAAIILQANQNQQHGGQAFPMFDYDLSLYVNKSYEKHIKDLQELPLNISDKEIEKIAWNKTKRDTYQAMEAFVHNMNSMNSRSAGQVPFTSINYGTDTSKEGRLIIESILKATEAGLGHGETPIFPIQIFKIKDGINYNENDPNYDLFKLACQVTSKRLFPNFSFIDASYNLEKYIKTDPETEVAYMGCRTRVLANVNGKEGVVSRGNLSFTTINLVKIALESNKDITKFYNKLDKYVEIAKKQLLDRYNFQCNKRARNFKFMIGQGLWVDSEKLKPNDTLHNVLKHGTLSIGFIGLAEALKALTGNHHGESQESLKLGYEIISFMREKINEYTKEYNLNFTLLATPAESLSGKFVKKDKIEFGEIKGVTDREYYTNSFHIPVYYNIKIIDKIEKEAPFHELCNAGHITYVEIDGNARENPEAIMQIIRIMKENNIGYGSINHPIDRCPVCGFGGIIGNECPECHVKEQDGIKFERIRRITGYLVGTLDRWNSAKQAEERDRVKHQ